MCVVRVRTASLLWVVARAEPARPSTATRLAAGLSSCRDEVGRPIGDILTPTFGSGARGSSIHGEFASSSDKILFGGGRRHWLFVNRLFGIISVDDRWCGDGACSFVADVFIRLARSAAIRSLRSSSRSLMSDVDICSLITLAS